jgi:hypothetical protein
MKSIRLDENWLCIIGKNRKENWKILEDTQKEINKELKEETTNNVFFFHLSSFPSCFVILKSKEKISDHPGIEIIKKASLICLENTKYKNLNNIYVDYTNISNVKKTENVGEIEYISLRKVFKIKV